MTTSPFLLPAAGLGTSMGCKFGWSNTRKKSTGASGKGILSLIKKQQEERHVFLVFLLLGSVAWGCGTWSCGTFLHRSGGIAGNRTNGKKTAQREAGRSLGPWDTASESAKPRAAPWLPWFMSFLLSYSFASFLFLEAKDTPSVTGRVTADHYHHPFYLVSKACNLQQTRTTFLPALWSVGYSPHLFTCRNV